MPRVVHFEIHADDPERASRFYREVFGWNIIKWAGPVEYWLVTTGTESELGINGGIMKRKGAPPQDQSAVNSYVCTIEVPNFDECSVKAQKAGGINVVAKMPVPGVGWMGYFKDTEGNIFGMMQADSTAK